MAQKYAGIGETLREWRLVCGKTISEAADACEVTTSTMFDMETNKIGPTGEILRRLETLYSDVENPTFHDLRLPGTEIPWMDLARQAGYRSNRVLLDEVSLGIRRLRNLLPGAAVRMRETELDLLISMLDLSSPDCAADMAESFDIPILQARAIIARSTNRVTRRDQRAPALAA